MDRRRATLVFFKEPTYRLNQHVGELASETTQFATSGGQRVGNARSRNCRKTGDAGNA